MATELDSLRRSLRQAGARWQAGPTSLLELSPAERRRRLGYVPTGDEPSLQEREEISYRHRATRAFEAAVPQSIDWRSVGGRNFVTSIKNQASCGSCVAFGTAATLESAERVEMDIAVGDPGGDVLPELSEAQLFFCGAGEMCDVGWNAGSALEYSKQPGVAPQSCFPYSDHNQPCELCANSAAESTRISGWRSFGAVAEMKQWLLDHGPLVTGFSVYADFYGYSSGVYHHVSGKFEGGHVIECIGFDDNQQAWLCKNSWGGDWGEGGYFWIGYGECGIDAWMGAVTGFAVIYPLYTDLYVRDNLANAGAVPKAGSPCQSPDIVPTGTMPLEDPAELAKNWLSDPGVDLQGEELNYLYVRAKNLALGPAQGTASLYWSPASLLLWPEQWTANRLKTEAEEETVALEASEPGEVAVGRSPFVWKPSLPSGGDHYCLVSTVATAAHPIELPGKFPTMEAWAEFIQSHPNFGWRNVTVVKGDTPQYEVELKLTIHDAVELYVLVQGDGLPAGCEVQFACGEAGPKPLLTLKRTPLPAVAEPVLGIRSSVPADFDANLTLAFWNDGHAVPAGATLTLQALYVVDDEHRLAEHAERYDDAGIGPVTGVPVGSYTIKFE
ncbi:MAG: C1 family peptidase [Solirubrobacterales bacterium]